MAWLLEWIFEIVPAVFLVAMGVWLILAKRRAWQQRL